MTAAEDDYHRLLPLRGVSISTIHGRDTKGGLLPPSTRGGGDGDGGEWIPDEAPETIILAGEKSGGKGGNADYPEDPVECKRQRVHSLSLTTRRRTRFRSVLGAATTTVGEIVVIGASL